MCSEMYCYLYLMLGNGCKVSKYTMTISMQQSTDNNKGIAFICYKWSDFLVADPEVPGSISGAARFSE
jgi:hypothetical protein